MPRRKERPIPQSLGLQRPDRRLVLRLVETILHLGAYDKHDRLSPEWMTLFDLVNVEDRSVRPDRWRTPAPQLVYGFRFGGLPTDDPEQLTELLLEEFDEAAVEFAAATLTAV